VALPEVNRRFAPKPVPGSIASCSDRSQNWERYAPEAGFTDLLGSCAGRGILGYCLELGRGRRMVSQDAPCGFAQPVVLNLFARYLISN
jgi:hypothetical protein